MSLNKLHSMFESENLRHDFTQVQMEQMVSRDVRDNTLTLLEHMELDDESALEAAAKNKVEDDGTDTDDDGEEDMEELDEGLSDLDIEIESLEQEMIDVGEDDHNVITKGPLAGMSAVNDDYDPAIEQILATIPEATIKEVVEFFNATEEDGSFEQNTALESEMAVIDMLIPEVF